MFNRQCESDSGVCCPVTKKVGGAKIKSLNLGWSQWGWQCLAWHWLMQRKLIAFTSKVGCNTVICYFTPTFLMRCFYQNDYMGTWGSSGTKAEQDISTILLIVLFYPWKQNNNHVAPPKILFFYITVTLLIWLLCSFSLISACTKFVTNVWSPPNMETNFVSLLTWDTLSLLELRHKVPVHSCCERPPAQHGPLIAKCHMHFRHLITCFKQMGELKKVNVSAAHLFLCQPFRKPLHHRGSLYRAEVSVTDKLSSSLIYAGILN